MGKSRSFKITMTMCWIALATSSMSLNAALQRPSDNMLSAYSQTDIDKVATGSSQQYHNYIRDRFDIIAADLPMRDGVKLHTVILRPRKAPGTLPILYELTPYGAANAVIGHPWFGVRSPDLAVTLGAWSEDLVEEGFIFVYQDIRGKGGSEGRTVLYPEPRQPADSTSKTSVSTDIYDTTQWLVTNVGGNNGKVAIWGTSYSGRTAIESLLLPHPALKAVVAMNPVVDMWTGDDFYHQGAFRLAYAVDWIRNNGLNDAPALPYGASDAYDWYLRAGPAAEYETRWFEQPLPLWNAVVANPIYTDFWKRQALDRLIATAPPSNVALLSVHGWFDQEDNYGAPAVFAAREKMTPAHNYFVAGPWQHGQGLYEASRLGPLVWNADTARQFRREMLLPFLRRYLKDEPGPPLAKATIFQTGKDAWENGDAWPGASSPARLYLKSGGRLAFSAPPETGGYTAYVSDPAKPVPYRLRPIAHISGPESTWSEWLVDDQRFADGRPDVLTFASEPLIDDMVVTGRPAMTLFASTSGSDADWVIKFIDVYPDEVAGSAKLGGYQLMVSADIQRGRYRSSFAEARAIVPGKALPFRIAMPPLHHRFRKGHRMMIQIQSSWFPLYDLNPQTFVPAIAQAVAADYRKAEQRVFHDASHASFLTINLAPPGRR